MCPVIICSIYSTQSPKYVIPKLDSIRHVLKFHLFPNISFFLNAFKFYLHNHIPPTPSFKDVLSRRFSVYCGLGFQNSHFETNTPFSCFLLHISLLKESFKINFSGALVANHFTLYPKQLVQNSAVQSYSELN